MVKWNREELEKHLNVILKYNFDEIPIEYAKEYSSKIPIKFYKYREFKNMHLNALENDYIWLSFAKNFPDKSDSTIRYDFRTHFKKIQKVVNDLLPELVFEEIKKQFILKRKVNPSVFENISLEEALQWIKDYTYKSGKFNYGKTRNYLRSKKFTNKQIDEFEKYAKKTVNQLASINDKFRELYYIHCFSGNYDNPFLWDKYTNYDEGFCIEYDLMNQTKDLISLFPILYKPSEDIDMAELIRLGIENNLGKESMEDNHKFAVKVFSHFLTKHIKYETETEWRLIISKDNQKNNEYNFPHATAIYLGIEMKDRNKKRLINIAKKKGIKVYQRQRNKFNTDYEYKQIL